jgi:hypothetical protein
MRYPVLALAAFALFAVAAVACGGGSKTADFVPNATSTPADTFDYTLLNAVVLQQSDMPPGYEVTGGFAPQGGPGTAFNSRMTLGPIIVNSTVVRFPDVATRDQNLDHDRRGLAALIGPESNLDIAGANAAFMYGKENPPAQASLVLRDEFLVTVVMQTRDMSEAAAVTNKDDLKRYTSIVFDRLQRLIAQPDSLTPISAYPTYDARPPEPTPTPVATP